MISWSFSHLYGLVEGEGVQERVSPVVVVVCYVDEPALHKQVIPSLLVMHLHELERALYELSECWHRGSSPARIIKTLRGEEACVWNTERDGEQQLVFERVDGRQWLKFNKVFTT